MVLAIEKMIIQKHCNNTKLIYWKHHFIHCRRYKYRNDHPKGSPFSMPFRTRITRKNRKLQKQKVQLQHVVLFIILLSCCNWKYLFYDTFSSNVSNEGRYVSLVMAYVPTATTTTTTTTSTWSSNSMIVRYQSKSYKKRPILRSPQSSTSRISPYKTVSLHSIHSSDSDGTNKQVLPSTFQQRLNFVLTGQQTPEQPYWIKADAVLRRILPGSIMNLRPSVQLVIVLLFYMLHTLVLAQHSIPFPFQLIPNERGNFQSIGLDS